MHTLRQTPLFAAPPPVRRPTPRYALGELSALAEASVAAIDCETDRRDPLTASLTHVAFATDTRISGFVRAEAGALRALAALAHSRRVVMHNAGYDLVVLSRHGVNLLDGTIDDTRVLSQLFNEHADHDLVNAADRWLHHRGLVSFRELPNLDGLSDADRDALMADKGRVDCEQTLELFEAARDALAGAPQLAAAYERVERPVLPVFASMSLRGVLIDTGALQKRRAALAAQTAATITALQSTAGVGIDPLSDEQVAHWLYDRIGLLPAARSERTGRGSVSRPALEALHHPCAVLVLEARSLAGQLRAIDRWSEQFAADGTFHPRYSAWGRPNAPITVSTPIGCGESDDVPVMDARPFVRAGPDRVLVAVSLHGVRLGWLAHVSADPVLRAAMMSGTDPAAAVADRVAPAQAAVVPIVRAWLDALCAGDGPRAVARATGWRQKDAAALGDALRDALPAVFRMADHLADAGCKRGWIQTPLGRRRRYDPRYAGRRALADLLEIAATDTVKLALRALWDQFADAVALVAADTVLLDVPEHAASDVVAAAQRIAATPPPGWAWPVRVRVGIGVSWAEAVSS